MDIKIFGLELMSASTADQIRAEAAAAGHTVVEASAAIVHTATDELVSAVKAAYPQLIADGKAIIATLTNKDENGGLKAIELAEEMIKTAPDVLTALPNAKDFFVKLGTSIYTDGLAELETAAKGVLDEVKKLL